ncbi:MAG: 4-hydroxy-3-methylbut-2-enyl diphosphate reductase [Bacteroidales bacterium]|nr:4-hydroxy-3-methylbut-2-enyl diphosphate reductase [Bacteroidales bacterium]
MIVEIDENAGFCSGVTNAINKAEAEISASGSLFCLGEMVHNQEEMSRLEKLGMKTVTYREFETFSNCTVLIRAHGEPPETYALAKKNNISLIDATCPIVLRLHKIIYQNSIENPDYQTVIFGKKDHAEVVGLVGQVGGKAVVISKEEETDKIDFTKSIFLYSQTTMNVHDYEKVAEKIENRLKAVSPEKVFKKFNTVCRSVSKREEKLSEYAKQFDAVLFVAGNNSSNGKYLFSTCKASNPKSYYISSESDLTPEMIKGVERLGITGATSTPKWLLRLIAEKAAKL